jgi:hypothetical protein
MTIAVPAQFMAQANQLALAVGESHDDVNTFINTGWQDASGNLYAVCSAVVKPVVLALFGGSLEDALIDPMGSNLTAAQAALDSAIMFDAGVTATPDKIVIAIDADPMTVLKDMGLSLVISDDGLL